MKRRRLIHHLYSKANSPPVQPVVNEEKKADPEIKLHFNVHATGVHTVGGSGSMVDGRPHNAVHMVCVQASRLPARPSASDQAGRQRDRPALQAPRGLHACNRALAHAESVY